MQYRRLRRRTTGALLAACTLVAAGALAAPGPAAAASAEEQRVLQLANQVRAAAGSVPLVLDEGLSVTARQWSATVAASGVLSHNPAIPRVSSGQTALAENVVVGDNIEQAHGGLVNSRTHYDNMVNPTVTRVGIGVSWGRGRVYIVQNFLIVRGATAPATTPTTVRAPVTTPSTAAPRAPAATTTTLAPAVVPAPPTTVPAPATAPATGPSDWLRLSFDVLRSWDRAAL